jgi:hypothetical protein
MLRVSETYMSGCVKNMMSKWKMAALCVLAAAIMLAVPVIAIENQNPKEDSSASTTITTVKTAGELRDALADSNDEIIILNPSSTTEHTYTLNSCTLGNNKEIQISSSVSTSYYAIIDFAEYQKYIDLHGYTLTLSKNVGFMVNSGPITGVNY